MSKSPVDAFGDETHILEVDVLELLGCYCWEQILEYRLIPVNNEDLIPGLINDIQAKIPSLSSYFAEAIVRYCLIKGIHLNIFNNYYRYSFRNRIIL